MNFLLVKGGFFSENAIRFFKSPKKIFQKTILSLKFKFQVQDSFLEYFFFEIGRFEKRITLSEKKPPLGVGIGLENGIFCLVSVLKICMDGGS